MRALVRIVLPDSMISFQVCLELSIYGYIQDKHARITQGPLDFGVNSWLMWCIHRTAKFSSDHYIYMMPRTMGLTQDMVNADATHPCRCTTLVMW